MSKSQELCEKAKTFRMKIKTSFIPEPFKGQALSFLNEIVDFLEGCND